MILASEIGDLEDLTGYFKVPGYTLRLEFAPVPPKIIHPVTIFRNAPDYSVPPLAKVPRQSGRPNRRRGNQSGSGEGAAETAKAVDNRRLLQGGKGTGDTYPTVGTK